MISSATNRIARTASTSASTSTIGSAGPYPAAPRLFRPGTAGRLGQPVVMPCLRLAPPLPPQDGSHNPRRQRTNKSENNGRCQPGQYGPILLPDQDRRDCNGIEDGKHGRGQGRKAAQQFGD